MFGYIRTDTPELRVRENEYYRAVYCGLCRAQGKCTGACSRMTLSYDMVFLALLRLAVSGEIPEIKRGRCIAHPLKKRNYLDFCDSLAYCANASALLVYGKAIDDLQDEKGSKRLKARLTRPIAKHMRKKARKELADLDQKITDGLRRLAAVEAQKLPSVDIPADCFGDILADLLSYGLPEREERIMRNIGKHIGRWIYIVDAADDLDDDLKADRFNAFACLYGNNVLDESHRRDVANSLKLELMAAEPAFDLIDYRCDGNVEELIKNIIYRGMPNVAERILSPDEKQSTKKNKRKPKG